MTTTMDAAGRLVVPKSVREASGFAPGVPLEVHFRDGRIEIEPAPTEVRLSRRGRVMVATPVAEGPPLDTGVVEATRAALRSGRG